MRTFPRSALTWLLATILVAAIVHITSVFLMPALAQRDSYSRLAPMLDDTGFRTLPSATPGSEALPFTDPGVLLAACRFDLSKGPWRVRVAVDSEALTSLSFRSRTGAVFHVLTDRAALQGRLDVLLGTAAQIDAVEAADTDDAPTREVRLVAPATVGLVFMRSMAPSASGIGSLTRRISAADCRSAV